VYQPQFVETVAFCGPVAFAFYTAIAQNEKKYILVVCELSHAFDKINMHMLRPLAQSVF
jgi:hypothetical protein